MIIYLAQIIKIFLLCIEKKSEYVLVKYLDFINIFLKKLIIELLRCLGINKYTINLVKSK